MLLGKVFKNLNRKYKSVKFNTICFNSKKCKPNDIFFAIKGNNSNGNKFIGNAINNGARVVVSDLKYEGLNKKKILFIKSKDPRKLLSEVASNIYNKKPKNIIAVTGTNGKTSIVNFYYQIMSLNKKNVASFGTLGVVSKKLKLDLGFFSLIYWYVACLLVGHYSAHNIKPTKKHKYIKSNNDTFVALPVVGLVNLLTYGIPILILDYFFNFL